MKLFAQLVVYFLASLVPKNKRVWIFGAWFGKNYSDNSRALFEYAIKNNNSINKYYWVYKNRELEKFIPCNGVYAYSIKGIILQARAGVCVMSQDKDDFIRPLISSRAIKVQLWHGFPIKKIGRHARKKKNNKVLEFLALKKNLLLELIFPFSSNKYDLVIASGEFDAEIFKEAFDVNKSNVCVTGYPRNDIIVKKQKTNVIKIIYMPTFRGVANSGFDLFHQYGWNSDGICKSLDEINAVMHIRFHPVHKISEVDKKILNNGRVSVIEGEWDANANISSYDILVTDYSSVYADYILVGGKIVLAQFDLDEYVRSSRDCYINFAGLKANLKINSWKDFEKSIKNVVTDDQIKFDVNFFHKHTDGLAARRVYEEIMNVTKNS